MSKPNYSLPWILPYVRKVVKLSSNFNYETFMSQLWMQMEPAVPDIRRYDPLRQQQLRRVFDYNNPKELPSVANEAFFFLSGTATSFPKLTAVRLSRCMRHAATDTM